MAHLTKHLALNLLLMVAFVSTAKAEVIYAQVLDAEESPVGHYLKWATATEIDVSTFVIEKSTDGHAFFEIGSLPAAGFSKVDKNYHFMEVGASDPKNYYRLKEVSEDGTSSYTEAVVLNKKLVNLMNVMSMTSTDVDSTFNLTLDVLREAALTCSVTDLGGKEYDTFQFQAINGVNKISVNFENFTPGMYKFNVRLGEETESFVLQRMLDNRMSNPQTAGTKTFKNAKGRQ